MRRAVRALAVLALLAGGAPTRAAGEEPALAPFLTGFRAALARDDAAAVADLTQLPFLFENEPRDRAGFVAIYPKLFPEPVRACLAKTAPVPEEDRWVAFCGVYLFYFGRAGGEIRLLEFAVDPEAEP